MKVNIKRGNNNDPLDNAKRKIGNIPLPPPPFMLSEQIVLQKPDNGGQSEWGATLTFRPLAEAPELLKTDLYVDDTRTKIMSDLAVFNLVGIDPSELPKLYSAQSQVNNNSNSGLPNLGNVSNHNQSTFTNIAAAAHAQAAAQSAAQHGESMNQFQNNQVNLQRRVPPPTRDNQTPDYLIIQGNNIEQSCYSMKKLKNRSQSSQNDSYNPIQTLGQPVTCLNMGGQRIYKLKNVSGQNDQYANFLQVGAPLAASNSNPNNVDMIEFFLDVSLCQYTAITIDMDDETSNQNLQPFQRVPIATHNAPAAELNQTLNNQTTSQLEGVGVVASLGHTLPQSLKNVGPLTQQNIMNSGLGNTHSQVNNSSKIHKNLQLKQGAQNGLNNTVPAQAAGNINQQQQQNNQIRYGFQLVRKSPLQTQPPVNFTSIRSNTKNLEENKVSGLQTGAQNTNTATPKNNNLNVGGTINQNADENSKNVDIVIFICESYDDYMQWEQTLNSYVIQTKKIQSSYTFKEKLGEGSFGLVYLATLKDRNNGLSFITENILREGIIRTYDHNNPHPMAPQTQQHMVRNNNQNPHVDIDIKQNNTDNLKKTQGNALDVSGGILSPMAHKTLNDNGAGGKHTPSHFNARKEAGPGLSHSQYQQNNMNSLNNQLLSGGQKNNQNANGNPQNELKVAIKQLRKQQLIGIKTGIPFLLNEIKVHWALEDCETVLKLHQLFEDREYIYMVLEYQPKGSLMNTLEQSMQFTEHEVRVIMEQLLLALDFFERKQVVHRDIKLDNILIKKIEEKTNYEVRVADFGLATFAPNDQQLTHKCGSPGYVAPEIFKKSGYSYKADVFSLGSVFFNLLTGRYLFSADNPQDLLVKNIKCQISHIKKYLSSTTQQCRDLLMWMLEADPDKRPSAKEALMHDWFKCDKEVLKELLRANNILCTNTNRDINSHYSQSLANSQMSAQNYQDMLNSFQQADGNYFKKNQPQYQPLNLGDNNRDGSEVSYFSRHNSRYQKQKTDKNGTFLLTNMASKGSLRVPNMSHRRQQRSQMSVDMRSESENGGAVAQAANNMNSKPFLRSGNMGRRDSSRLSSFSSNSRGVSYFRALRESKSANRSIPDKQKSLMVPRLKQSATFKNLDVKNLNNYNETEHDRNKEKSMSSNKNDNNNHKNSDHNDEGNAQNASGSNQGDQNADQQLFNTPAHQQRNKDTMNLKNQSLLQQTAGLASANPQQYLNQQQIRPKPQTAKLQENSLDANNKQEKRKSIKSKKSSNNSKDRGGPAEQQLLVNDASPRNAPQMLGDAKNESSYELKVQDSAPVQPISGVQALIREAREGAAAAAKNNNNKNQYGDLETGGVKDPGQGQLKSGKYAKQQVMIEEEKQESSSRQGQGDNASDYQSVNNNRSRKYRREVSKHTNKEVIIEKLGSLKEDEQKSRPNMVVVAAHNKKGESAVDKKKEEENNGSDEESLMDLADQDESKVRFSARRKAYQIGADAAADVDSYQQKQGAQGTLKPDDPQKNSQHQPPGQQLDINQRRRQMFDMPIIMIEKFSSKQLQVGSHLGILAHHNNGGCGSGAIANSNNHNQINHNQSHQSSQSVNSPPQLSGNMDPFIPLYENPVGLPEDMKMSNKNIPRTSRIFLNL